MLSTLLLAAPLLFAGEDALPEAPPDVIVIVGDDISLHDMDFVETPTLDFLASQGVSFRRAHTHALCSPTRRALFFGRWPGRHVQSSCVAPTARTPHHSEYSMGKLFKGKGYSTGLFGKWHLGTNELGAWEISPNLHGFDTWRAGLPANVVNCGGNTYFDWTRVDDGVSSPATRYQTYAVRDAFLNWWRNEEGPKFAYVGYQSAHLPLHAPPGVPSFPWQDRELFEFMVQSLDEAIGDMLSVVDLSRTYVVFLGDNGTPKPAAGPGQNRNKVKPTTYRDGVVVPMIVAGPGIVPGENESLVHAVDVLATLADLIRAPVPAHLRLDSRSFAGALVDPKEWRSPRPFVFCENDTPGLALDRAVVTRNYKLRNLEGVEELYDLRKDPRERNPLDLTDPRYGELLRRMREMMEDPSGVSARY